MTERTRLGGDPGAAQQQEATLGTREPAAPTAAVLGSRSGHALASSRASHPAFARAIGVLQGTAGNGAVARLLATASSTRPVAPAATRSVGAEGDGTASPAIGEGAATAQRAGAPTPGPSWTKIGPATSSSFSVSGTLREVATALAARPEAGSTTTYSDLDQETYAPPDGEDRITAARFTVFQEVALPTWSDKGAATTKQQAEWNRFSAAIKAHEDGHVATDRKSYANAHRKIKGQTPTDGDTIWKGLDEQAKKDNKAFDTATDSGRNTGTNINANIDEVTKVP